MKSLKELEKLKYIAEWNLDSAKHVKDKYPRLEEKYREMLADVVIEIAKVKAAAFNRAQKRKRRGEA